MDNTTPRNIVLEFWDFFNEKYDDDIQEIEEILDTANKQFSDSSSSSDESDYEQRQHPSCSNFISTIDEFDEDDFKSHVRLKRSTVEYLIARFEEKHPTTNLNPGTLKSSAKQMYVWYISNTITYRQLANLFGVTKSTSWKNVKRVVEWLISIGGEFLTWPTGTALENSCQKFKQKKKIPGVVGSAAARE